MNLTKLLVAAILFKRKKKDRNFIEKLSESDLPAIRKGKEVTTNVEEKRKKLKEAYTAILKNTPWKSSIPFFHQMIDGLESSYLDYELGLNLNGAMGMIKELIQGEGDFTDNEVGNLGNIIAGIGIPAIQKHAATNAPIDDASVKFASTEMNKNLEELMGSLEQRRSPKNKLSSPARKQLPTPPLTTVTPTSSGTPNRLSKILGMFKMDDTQFWKLASKISDISKADLTNFVSRMGNVIKKSTSYEEAKKSVEKEAKKAGIEFSQTEDLFFKMFSQNKKQKIEF